MQLKDTTAVITGSTGHLGSAIAPALARAGCDCVCHYHKNKQFAEELVEQISSIGRKAIAVEADLSRPEQVKHLFEQSRDFSPPQVLVNSASIFFSQPIADVNFEDAHRLLDTNLVAPILAARYFVRLVNKSLCDDSKLDNPVAKIINLVDVGGIRPWGGYSVYCASKAGLIAATKSLAKELAPAVCVNAIAPGIINWPKHLDEAAKARQLAHIPAARIGSTDEVVSAVMFLLQNDYITGQTINVDGGRCI